MAKWNVGEKNGLWKGGRSVASNGYVLIRVGVDHHLADVRGYAYEHRLVAEAKLGRRLRPGEEVHHIDEDKQNNDPANLEVAQDAAHHHVHHRKPGGKVKRLPGEPNPEITCGCGCGARLPRFDGAGRARSFISGHNPPPEATTATALLRLLTRKPAKRRELAVAAGTTVQAVASCLTKLKRVGMVANGADGEWSIVAAGPASTQPPKREEPAGPAGAGRETPASTAG